MNPGQNRVARLAADLQYDKTDMLSCGSGDDQGHAASKTALLGSL